MKKNFTFCLVLTTFNEQVNKVNLQTSVVLKINATFTFFHQKVYRKCSCGNPSIILKVQISGNSDVLVFWHSSVTSGESCFLTDTAVRREVKRFL